MIKTSAPRILGAVLLLSVAQIGFAYAEPETTGTTPQDKEKERIEQQTKLYQAEKAMWEAREAASKAEAASTTARFGPLATYDNSKGGSVSLAAAGQTAGSLEGNLLAASATREAADELAQRLCVLSGGGQAGCKGDYRRTAASREPEPPKLTYNLGAIDPCESLLVPDSLPAGTPAGKRAYVFLSEGQNSNFEIYETLMVRLTAAGRQMCNALDVAEQQNIRTAALLKDLPKTAAPKGPTRGGGFGIETAATALSTLANLFKTDYTVAYHSLTPDNLLLIKETVAGFMGRRPNAWVHAPELFPLAPSEGDNPLEAKLAVMDKILGRVVEETGEQARLNGLLSTAATPLKGELLARVNAAADMHKAHRDTLIATAKTYTDFLSTSAQGTDAKQPPLAIGLRQARAAQMLKTGGVLVLMKMNLMGATSYTKKNFWTNFGGMPFYASGGVIASYAVMEGRTGRILDAASVPVASGFQSVPAVHRSFRKQRSRDQSDR